MLLTTVQLSDNGIEIGTLKSIMDEMAEGRDNSVDSLYCYETAWSMLKDAMQVEQRYDMAVYCNGFCESQTVDGSTSADEPETKSKQVEVN